LTASTPEDAARLIDELKPAGMLLDIDLSGKMSGIDLLDYTRKVSPDTKVIMVTADGSDQSVKRAKSLGAVDYITKPLTLQRLEDTMHLKMAGLM
jgi:response regulator of citrate/malate metabolism